MAGPHLQHDVKHAMNAGAGKGQGNEAPCKREGGTAEVVDTMVAAVHRRESERTATHATTRVTSAAGLRLTQAACTRVPT